MGMWAEKGLHWVFAEYDGRLGNGQEKAEEEISGMMRRYLPKCISQIEKT